MNGKAAAQARAAAPVVHRHDDTESHTENTRNPQFEPTRQKLWQQANPLARWAHIALASGLRRGLIQRKPCELCGAEPADAHHDDYSRPLDVRFMCRKHHRQHHAKANREARK